MEKYIKIFIPKFLWEKIEENPELKKILANINWLFFDRAINMAVAFLVGVWVIRYLGPERYGILSYAAAFVALFGFIAKLGMDGIAVREFVKNPEKKEEIFGTLFFLRLLAGALAFACSIVAIFFVRNGDTLIFWLTFVIALGFIFQVSDVFDFWFQSQVASKYTVYIRSGVSLASGLVKITLILIHASLIAFASVMLFESVLTLLGFMFIFLKKKEKISLAKIDLSIGKQILSDSWPLILASVAVSVYMKIDQVMIGNMLGNKSVGIYSAAVSLSEMWYFFPLIVTTSVFPAILHAKKISKELYLNRIQMLYDGMVWVSIIIALVVTFFSKGIINLLFGEEYIQSASVLSIYVWAGTAVFLGVASGNFLLTENLTKISLVRSLGGGIVNILLNLYWIPKYGIIGSAWATVISYSISTMLIVFSKEARINVTLFFRTFNFIRIYKSIKKLLKT